MRRLVMLVTAFIVVALMTLPQAHGASGQSDDCGRALLAAPIETVTPPQGSQWIALDVRETGVWGGYVGSAGDPGTGFRGFVDLGCAVDAALVMERTAEVDAVLGQRTKLAVVPIGDETYATRSESEAQIMWRHGDIIGRVTSGRDNLDMGQLEAFAMSFDAVLP